MNNICEDKKRAFSVSWASWNRQKCPEIVLKFCKHWVLKFHFLLLGGLNIQVFFLRASVYSFSTVSFLVAVCGFFNVYTCHVDWTRPPTLKSASFPDYTLLLAVSLDGSVPSPCLAATARSPAVFCVCQ